MSRKRGSRRLAKKTRKATRKRKTVARKRPARKKPGNKRTLAKRKPRLTTVTGGEWAMPRKLADTDQQIERLRHHVSEQCVSIASSIDTIPPEMVPAEMRERWLREFAPGGGGIGSSNRALRRWADARGELIVAGVYAI
jgi:hypothetical protein